MYKFKKFDYCGKYTPIPNDYKSSFNSEYEEELACALRSGEDFDTDWSMFRDTMLNVKTQRKDGVLSVTIHASCDEFDEMFDTIVANMDGIDAAVTTKVWDFVSERTGDFCREAESTTILKKDATVDDVLKAIAERWETMDFILEASYQDFKSFCEAVIEHESNK